MGKARKPPKKGAEPPAPPADPRDRELDDDERLFVEQYLVDRNQYRAYRRTFPGTSARVARSHAYLMARRPHVRAEIQAGIAEQRRRCRVKADAALEELAVVAFSDVLGVFDPETNTLLNPRHIPYDTRKAVKSIKVSRERRSVTRAGRTTTTVTETVVEYQFWDKLNALNQLREFLGLKTEIAPVEALMATLPPAAAAVLRQLMTAPRDALPAAATPRPEPAGGS